MQTIKDVRRLVIRGGEVELKLSAGLRNAIEVSEDQIGTVSEEAEGGQTVLTGYRGRVVLPAYTPLTIQVEGGRVVGELGAGKITAGDLDLSVRAPESERREERESRLTRFVHWLKDLVGILGSIVVFWMIFRAIPFFKDPNDYVVWQVVLGAGAYYGFSGRWVCALTVALLAIVGDIVHAGLGDWQVYAKSLIKLAVFLGIMGGGKWVRDYLERFSRHGYTGLKNRHAGS